MTPDVDMWLEKKTAPEAAFVDQASNREQIHASVSVNTKIKETPPVRKRFKPWWYPSATPHFRGKRKLFLENDLCRYDSPAVNFHDIHSFGPGCANVVVIGICLYPS